MRIVAIGGGEIGRPGFTVDTTELDAEVVRLTGKRRPRVLFVPTATQDDEGYVSTVEGHYGTRLGCHVDALRLYNRSLTMAETERAIRRADIVYVGGGNTLRMMKMWRRRGVDRPLLAAAADGTVLAGISAGAICWCAAGVSDARAYTSDDEPWEYIQVRGLGLLDLLLCPHYDGDSARQDGLRRLAARTRRVGLGLDDCAALEIVDDRWRILSCRDGSRGHHVPPAGSATDLLPDDRFRPVADLTAKTVSE